MKAILPAAPAPTTKTFFLLEFSMFLPMSKRVCEGWLFNSGFTESGMSD